MKRWKRDLGLVRELGPDTPAFDEAVARVYSRLEALESTCEALTRAVRDLVDDRIELERRHKRVVDRLERLEVERLA